MRKWDAERILEFFAKYSDCLYIVEGKKDVRALNTLDLSNILAINGKPLIAITEKVANLQGINEYPDIIILTDFDKEGRRLASRLVRLLHAHKVSPNQRLRSRIMNFGFNKIEDMSKDSILSIDKKSRKFTR